MLRAVSAVCSDVLLGVALGILVGCSGGADSPQTQVRSTVESVVALLEAGRVSEARSLYAGGKPPSSFESLAHILYSDKPALRIRDTIMDGADAYVLSAWRDSSAWPMEWWLRSNGKGGWSVTYNTMPNDRYVPNWWLAKALMPPVPLRLFAARGASLVPQLLDWILFLDSDGHILGQARSPQTWDPEGPPPETEIRAYGWGPPYPTKRLAVLSEPSTPWAGIRSALREVAPTDPDDWEILFVMAPGGTEARRFRLSLRALTIMWSLTQPALNRPRLTIDLRSGFSHRSGRNTAHVSIDGQEEVLSWTDRLNAPFEIQRALSQLVDARLDKRLSDLEELYVALRLPDTDNSRLTLGDVLIGIGAAAQTGLPVYLPDLDH